MRFAAALALACVVPMTAAAQVQGPPAPPPAAPPLPVDADAALARTKDLVDPIRRCKSAGDGSIDVCGSDTERHRLSPELRAIAGVGQSTKDSRPRVEVKTMSLDKLPYNWVSMGGRFKPGPEYNPLYEMAKRATDPETGAPPVPESEP